MPLNEQELEQQRLAKIDARILPPELKEQPQSWRITLKGKVQSFFRKITGDSTKKYVVKGIRPAGAPTYRPDEGLVETSPDPEAYNALVRQRGEVFSPVPENTPEEICERMSQAATDHEFERVIVYPIQGEKRKAVLDLLESEEGKIRYPMFEYMSANIVNNDDLNSQSIIYKYSGRSHFTKPI